MEQAVNDLSVVGPRLVDPIAALLSRDIGLGAAAATAAASELIDAIAEEGFSGTRAQDILDRNRLRDTWNHALDVGRPERLGPSLLPHCIGAIADVLSGTGSLTSWLARSRAAIKAYERLSQYEGAIQFPTEEFERWRPEDAGVDTVLLCTVLHHEPIVDSLLDTVMRTRPTRLIVVENCLTDSWDQQMHDYMDSFFNLTLNEFGIPCPGEHRTIDEWTHLLTSYGRTRFIGELSAVPGIPFPYHLYIVDTAHER